ncbi:uncharacterized protein LOC143597936 [Bidens hawaiensis]|uniref:uncharacterized protein LOC143597936 n=1 Tax=Bidens hawaiensis TaxID=980011 RepID=UPI00404B30D2
MLPTTLWSVGRYGTLFQALWGFFRIIAGDLNEVREPSDRRNSEFIASNAAAFNKFIEEADLVEYQMGGGQFTYISDRGDKFSKLDCVLVCRRFMNGWPNVSLTVLAKECSDHRPVLLSAVSVNFDRFREPALSRPSLVCPELPVLQDVEAEALVVPISRAEIKRVVWDCDSDRAPGPDGFNFNFFKRFWGCFEGDFVKLCNEFYVAGSFSGGCLSSFIELIPKSNEFPGALEKVGVGNSKGGSGVGLVNGSPTREFNCYRGLRHGDPLSPFLFIIAMEALTGIMKRAVEEGKFRVLTCGNNGPLLSHLIYADDVIFIGAWERQNVLNLRRILRCFFMVSGLKVNLAKCRLFGVRVTPNEKQQLANCLGCQAGDFPFKYLGLQIGANMNLINAWDPVVEMFIKRLLVWKAKTLSFGGRVTVIRLVLNALPTYYFSLYRVPDGVLDRLRRTFFWGGSEDKTQITWVSWQRVTAPKEYGGLSLGSLQDTNRALLAKWWWRFKGEQDRLWRRVIWSIHHSSRDWNSIPARSSISGPWKQVNRNSNDPGLVGLKFELLIKQAVKSGYKTLFWLDFWIGSDSLRVKFSRLFRLEKNKECTVAERLVMVNEVICSTWDWRRAPESMLEVDEFKELLTLCQNVVLGVGDDDKVEWGLDRSGAFSVSSIKEKLKEFTSTPVSYRFEWNNWVPGKVDRIPVLTALAKRNIGVESLECHACGLFEEMTEHIFVSCGLAQAVWQNISIWCKAPQLFFFSVRDVLEVYKHTKFSKRKAKSFHAICLITLWCLWKARNDMVHDGVAVSIGSVIESIKLLSFLWIKNRSGGGEISWACWSRFDL